MDSVRLQPGTTVRTVRGPPTGLPSMWTPKAEAARRFGVRGTVGGHHDAHGLCYEVIHDDDGTTGSYDLDELVVVDQTKPKLMVTLAPSFGHFDRFADDDRLAGIRLNSAMMTLDELDNELALAQSKTVPVWFDVKGRQLRVAEAVPDPDWCILRMNHPISVDTPCEVLLKAGEDAGLLVDISEDGHLLTFGANPEFEVYAGESIHIRDPSFVVGGPDYDFFGYEREKIAKAKAAGVTRWFLSYVESQQDVDAFRALVGPAADLLLKIESQRGLRFVRDQFVPDEHTHLVAACGDLFVEVNQPHEILNGVKLILDRDPDAIVGSRMLLSMVNKPIPTWLRKLLVTDREAGLKHLDVIGPNGVPSLADLGQLAWLRDLGFKRFMLCDELCLDGDLLGQAINVFDAFRGSYPGTVPSRIA